MNTPTGMSAVELAQWDGAEMGTWHTTCEVDREAVV